MLVFEQSLRRKARWDQRFHGRENIQLTAVKTVSRGFVGMGNIEAYAWGGRTHRMDEIGEQDTEQIIRRDDAEPSLGRSRIEGARRGNPRPDQHERVLDWLNERLTAFRQDHLVADADQKLVVEIDPQPRERAACRRLAPADPHGCCRYALGLRQRFEYDEQIEIQITEP